MHPAVKLIGNPTQAGNGVSMNVLVIGGAGYIGSHVVKELMAAGHNKTVLLQAIFYIRKISMRLLHGALMRLFIWRLLRQLANR